ncbi:MAG: 4Fe-4S binding protein [Sandaracinaceae bacterium]|nr:4Fe-4S binding protein [Sandaracinaceae bacterium]
MITRLRRWTPQALRHLLQLGVIAFIVYAAFGTTWRNYKLAHNSSRLVGLLHGDGWGRAYAWNEEALSWLGEDTAAQSERFLGFPWAARIFGLDTADPFVAASQLVSAGTVTTTVLLGLVLPLLLALLFGKLFCSHLCPMRALFELGELVRAGLLRLKVPLPAWRPETRLGGWVLVGGLLATWASTTAVWLFILPYVSLGAGLFLLVTTGTASALFGVVALWWVVDVLFAPGLWCYNLCPTGFLLEQLGRFPLVALRKRGADPCAKGCDLCERACPYGLSPKDRTHRPACDGCGRCAAVCPTDRLVRRLPVIGALALAVLVAPSVALAHHNKGLPHYGYYANYPQVPTEEFVAMDGRWEIGATLFNFQGYDGRRTSSTPNDVKIYLYLYDTEADQSYSGPVDIELRRDGEVVARYDRTEPDEESVYSTRETLPESGTYQLVALVDGEEIALDFYVDLDDGVSWWVIALIVIPVALVFGLALFGRKKRRRRRGKAVAALSSLAVLALPGLARAQEAGCAAGDGSRQVLTDAGPIQVMSGLPPWLFVLGVALVLALSFVATEWLAPRVARSQWRLNLLRKKRVYSLVSHRAAQILPQLAMVGVLLALVYVGLSGSRVANLAPTAVWTIWWAGLIFVVLFFGSAWCTVCPWDGLASLASRLRILARVEPIGLGLRFPRALANLWPAIVLFVVLTWLELGWGVTTDPRATAYMGLGMAGLAVAGALLFDGKKFCQHACPVGRICGIYSTIAPLEIRARNKSVCARCTTEDCLNGNDRGYACPTGISLKVIQSSADCTMCGECLRSCDKRNVALNLRPFAADLRPDAKPRLDQAWLAVVLLSLTLFHGLSMTSSWESFEPGRASLLKWIGLTLGTSRVVSFTLAMIVVCAIPIALYWGSCLVAARWSGAERSAGELFVNYSFALLPVALFYHLAHNLMHLLMEGRHVVPLLSDPLGQGADLFGTASTRVGALLSDEGLWAAQVGLVLVGHVIGILVAHRVGHRLFAEPSNATRSLLPMFAMMVLVSAAGLGLMHLDMNMRLGRM